MEAIRINSKDKILEKIEVDPSRLESRIDISCKACKVYLRIYLTDKDNRQRKYLLYAGENANSIPFNTRNLNFFTFGHLLIQGNGLIIQDNTDKGEGIFDRPITSMYRSGEIESLTNLGIGWPTFEAVSKFIAESFDPLSERIYMEIANQKFPLLTQIDRIEGLLEDQKQSVILKNEISKLREDIEKQYNENIKLVTEFRKRAQNYSFFKNRRQDR